MNVKPQSLQQAYEKTVEALTSNQHLSFGHGSIDAPGEALMVFAKLFQRSPLNVFKSMAEPNCPLSVSVQQVEEIAGILKQRLEHRQPMAYVLGEAWFGDLRLLSDSRALVPRSLILEALDESLWVALAQADEANDLLEGPTKSGSSLHHRLLENGGEMAQVLDLCTGGGSIAIKAALQFPFAKVAASDLSPQALALAQANLQLHGLVERVSLHQGNLFESLSQSFDLILCNPPYVNAHSMAALPGEFLAEPGLALAGGADGMDIIRQIFVQAPRFMNEGGYLLLEIGHEAPYFEAAFEWLNYTYVPVQAGAAMLVLISKEDLVQMGELMANASH